MTYQPHAEQPYPPNNAPQPGVYGQPAQPGYANQPGFGGPPPAYGAPTPQPAYGAPTQPPPAYGALAPQAPKKRKKWPWILLAVVVVLILGCVGLFTLVIGGTKNAVETLDDNVSGKNAVAGAMNKPARDGKFEFTVKSMDCTKTSVGKSPLAVKAQGTYCIVSMTIKNIGDEAQTFDGTSQKAYDAKGTQYSDDLEAELAVNGDSSTFLQQINPGNQVTGKLVYDVPKGTKLTTIELHDSLFSGGVKIPLK
ncbi:DUF4352 domain-containing protein [Actinoplanes sp. Pm04-4]|uniref:DUF4352 domain-containing protein n=1 Tax=Paractinoplanes pyxinae TaxID=2997416 RepID=A0ABT4B9I6_9ACTN|nr:DUF4352 domain-containing protein [Actinoplanes pyxinae]MCY1142525.1 DUF4352 domain-containing protein [Actinoplanes pyxinae]